MNAADRETVKELIAELEGMSATLEWLAQEQEDVEDRRTLNYIGSQIDNVASLLEDV